MENLIAIDTIMDYIIPIIDSYSNHSSKEYTSIQSTHIFVNLLEKNALELLAAAVAKCGPSLQESGSTYIKSQTSTL